MKRQVAYAQEGITDPNNPDQFMVVFVDEDEAGYIESTYTGTLNYCERVAEQINAARRHTAQDVRDVVASSFRAQSRGNR